MKKRFTLLIGALGSGTTELFRHLGAHPQVLACRVAEPRFFTDDRKWVLGMDFYRSLWDFREPEERNALEASSDYALHPSVPCPAERIAQLPTGFRFVYLLRDPLERIEVHHARAVESGATREPLERGVPAEMLDASRYASQLDAYRRFFPPDDFLLLAHEDLVRDPVAVLRRVCSFLEIDPYFGFPGVQQRAPEPPAPPARPEDRAPVRRSWLERLRGRRPAPPAPPSRMLPRLGPAQRAALLEELREDLARLESEWDFSLSRWHLEP